MLRLRRENFLVHCLALVAVTAGLAFALTGCGGGGGDDDSGDDRPASSVVVVGGRQAKPSSSIKIPVNFSEAHGNGFSLYEEATTYTIQLSGCLSGLTGTVTNAGLWDAALNPIKTPPITVRKGGHSGHVAALGDKFLVTYGEGWVKGGGDNHRGTGDDIWARIVDNDGALGPEIPIAVDPRRAYRDWWSVVSASDRNWLVVWQRYSTAALWGALIDAKGRVTKKFVITDDVVTDRYGVYGVRYLPSLQRFLVTGTKPNGGFAALLDTHGTVLVLKTDLPRPAPQSHVIVQPHNQGARAVYPVVPSGVAVLDVGARSLRLVKTLEHPYRWDYMGTDGVFVTPDKVLFATLSRAGVQLFHVEGIADANRLPKKPGNF